MLRALGTGEDLPEAFYRARDEGLAYSREYMAGLRASQDEAYMDALHGFLDRIEAERGVAPGDGSPRERLRLSACLHLLVLLAHEVDSQLTADEISPRIRSLLVRAEACCTEALGVGSFDQVMRVLRKE